MSTRSSSASMRARSRRSARMAAAHGQRAEPGRLARTTRPTPSSCWSNFATGDGTRSIETFSVLYPTPKRIALELVAPTHFTARSARAGTPGRSQLGQHRRRAAALQRLWRRRRCHRRAGLRQLRHAGRLQGARSARHQRARARSSSRAIGGGWRGLKPKLAHEHGAIGCLIYSDPRDDGYFRATPIRAGGWRPADGVQRGSVADITLYPGDPLTPGRRRHAGRQATRIADATTLMKIPVLPISYADAQPLLAALARSGCAASWRGALPITYHIGPGPAKVHLMIESDWSQKPIYDVIATIRAASCPTNGWCAATIMTAGCSAPGIRSRAMSRCWRRPRRSVRCSRPAGGPPHADLRQLGRRGAGSARFDRMGRDACGGAATPSGALRELRLQCARLSEAGGSHSLQRLMNEVGAGMHDPETGVSVQARLRAKLRVDAYERPTTSSQEARRGCGPAPICRSARSARARTSRRFCSTWASPR